MKTLILGANGMLGHALQDVFPEAAKWDVEYIDITDAAATTTKIKNLKPNLIINSAAFTDVEGCESNRELCFKVNGYAVGNLAKISKQVNAVLVHISTDAVFDGKKKKGYSEDDKTSPIYTYGESKALGEQLLLRNTNKYFLIRSSWMFGRHGKKCFVDKIIEASREKSELRVVDDQHGSPTYAKDLAGKIRGLVDSGSFGVYHVTNSGVTTWFDFARRILELKGIKTPVVPIKTGELNFRKPRPEFAILLNNKTSSLRHWELALKEYLGVSDEKS